MSSRKQSSIRSKIMIPFMMVIAIIAIAAIIICIYTVSSVMYSYSNKSLKQDQIILHKNMATLKYEINNILSLLPYMRKISPYKFKTIIRTTNGSPLLDWKELRVLTKKSQKQRFCQSS